MRIMQTPKTIGQQTYQEKIMSHKIETIINTKEGVRMSVEDLDGDGVWIHMQRRGGTAYVSLTRSEAQQLLAGLQAALEITETA